MKFSDFAARRNHSATRRTRQRVNIQIDSNELIDASHRLEMRFARSNSILEGNYVAAHDNGMDSQKRKLEKLAENVVTCRKQL